MRIFQTTFSTTLTDADSKRHIPFTFQLPSGATQLTIDLSYAPHTVDGINSLPPLTVLDPNGFRGAGHRAKDQHIVIGTQHASVGFLPGPLPGGEWVIRMDVHLVMPGPPCEVRIIVRASDEQPQQPVRMPSPGRTASRARGWYRGDLHAHSIHSDARWDIPDLVAFSRARGLDFCSLSDHNTISGLSQMLSLSSDDLLTMGGMELTTFHGHALALGVRDWIDWRTGENGRGMEQIAREVEAHGGLFVMAHPMQIGDPYCTGCHWEYPEMRPGNAAVIEVWNRDWSGRSNNEDSLALVYGWLNDGCHLALTAGTDNHGQNPSDRQFGFNVVYAEELSEREILRAIRAGHFYLSSGPRLELNASAGNHRVMMGDVLNVAARTPIEFAASWEDAPAGAELALIADAQIREHMRVRSAGTRTYNLSAGDAGWCLLTLRDAEGVMLAMTNPIYLDGRD